MHSCCSTTKIISTNQPTTHPRRIVDNLPVATKVKSELRPDDVYYVRGFPVGAVFERKHFLFNHIKLVISYNEDHSPGE